MANAMTRSETLATQAGIDHNLSLQYSENSKADLLQAESLQAHAAELEADSAREELLAEGSLAQEGEFHAKAVGEEAEADALAVEAAAQEDVFFEETEKAAVEAAGAAEDMVETETETAGVAACEFIPFLDIICDVVGGVAALALQSQAAKLSAQSALDAAAAAAAKAEEKTMLSKIDVLQGEVAKDEGLATGFAADVLSEQALAAEEEAEVTREEAEAAELLQKSKEEEILAEEEAGKTQAEEMEAGRETGNAARHGLIACKDALVAGIFSIMVMGFFCIRVMVAIIIPGVAAIVGFIPYTTTIQETGTRVATLSKWGGNAVTSIPFRDLSYFAGHCGIFLLSMVALGPQLALLDHLHIQNQGGVILTFAATAAFVQSVLLHIFPLIVSISKADSNQRPAFCMILSSVASTVARGLFYLIPLFLMELCELRLLSSDFFFATDLPRLAIYCLCGTLLILGISFAMSLEQGDDDKDSESIRSEATVDETRSSETSTLLRVDGQNYNGRIVDDVTPEVTNATTTEERQWAIHQYINDLKLPFEILVATCMFVKLRECSPIFSTVASYIRKSPSLHCKVCRWTSIFVLNHVVFSISKISIDTKPTGETGVQ